MSGTPLSLAPKGTALVVGTSTIAAGTGVGGYIWSGLGGTVTGAGATTGTTTGVAVFTGAAGSMRPLGNGRMAVSIGVAGVLGAVGML